MPSTSSMLQPPHWLGNGWAFMTSLYPPSELAGPPNGLAEIIRRSQSLLDDDWDEEESPRPSRVAWERAVQFLEANARTGIAITPLRILPGPDGSIDLHWESGQYELLINVTANESAASFYGDDKERTGTAIKGTIDLSQIHQWLFQWIEQVSR